MNELVLELLALVGRVKPRWLAALFAKESDLEALKHARRELARFDLHAPEPPRPRIELAEDDARALRRMLARGDLGIEERAALRNALGLQLPKETP